MCSFVVTAAHVLDGANNFSVRLNLKAGGSDTLLTSTANLLLHDNPDNDIAVFPLKVDPTVFDVLAPAFTREDLDRIDAEKFDIGYGDIVHAIGLYTSHHGFIKNIPVVRSGSVAALLEEPVLGPNDRYIEAYLIDLRTIAGLSGSPVFLMPPEIAVGENGLLSKRRTPPTIPLGVLLAYHLVAHANDQIIVPRHPSKSAGAEDADGFTADERNTGFGVVVPFDRVAEILKSDRVWDFMALGVEARNRERGKAKPA